MKTKKLCGGAFYFLAGYVRSASRSNFSPDDRLNYVGFRVAKGMTTTRILRGGSFYNTADVGRSACSYYVYPGYRSNDVGFRVARGTS